jgi:hypothetical protein
VSINDPIEYKVVADYIVSPDDDIVVSLPNGSIYMNSISEENRLATIADVGSGGSGIVPLPAFLTYVTGREHLPVLNQNFGWDSNGVYFGPTTLEESEEGEESYPIFTNFTIPQNTPVTVEFDVLIEEFCSDAGVAIFVDGTIPVWRWDPDSTRIAAQFNCPDPSIYGIEGTGTLSEDSQAVPGPGVYRFSFAYNPTAETDKVLFGYFDENSDLLALVTLNETLPEGDYRIGFSADNDRDDEGPSEGVPTDRTYIKNLTITVDPETENEVIYTDTLTNGSSGSSNTGADTGDITFDGVKIIGAGDASGDGNGYGTIELVPDASRYEYDQYLIIDPTEPNHIHIRAGGTQDDSNAELILGGEKTHLRLVDDYGLARMQAAYEYSTSYGTNDWESAVVTGDEFNRYIEITNPQQYVLDFLNSSQWQVSNETSVQIDGGERLDIYGLNTGEGNLVIYLPFEEPVLEPTPIETITFYWTNLSRIEIDMNDDEEISIRGNGIDVSIESTDDIYINAEDVLGLRAENNIVISSNGGGEYLNDDENELNQIATIGDLPTGASGSFTSQDGKTITVTNGIITSIV